jgi:hypothetical protein
MGETEGDWFFQIDLPGDPGSYVPAKKSGMGFTMASPENTFLLNVWTTAAAH